jgi:hypothetical protein
LSGLSLWLETAGKNQAATVFLSTGIKCFQSRFNFVLSMSSELPPFWFRVPFGFSTQVLSINASAFNLASTVCFQCLVSFLFFAFFFEAKVNLCDCAFIMKQLLSIWLQVFAFNVQ